jgi:hypothetical protein
MCYSQIGGLTMATINTLILVPVLYAIFVINFKMIAWDVKPAEPADSPDLTLPASAASEQ